MTAPITQALHGVRPPNQKQHTLGHHLCPACAEVRAMHACSITADLTFTRAAEVYMQMRSVAAIPGARSARYIRENTEQSYRQYIRTLELFFGGMPLKNIEWWHFMSYQEARVRGDDPFIRYRRPQDAHNGKGKTPCPAQPKKARQELGLLKQLLQRAGCWTEQMQENYHPIPDQEKDIPRALTPREQQRWLDVSRMSARWNIIYWYSLLAFSTCMSTDELRAIRLGDINLYQRVLVVPRGKVRSRARTLELVGADVLWALEQLMARAREMGASDYQHYLFPARRAPGKWNPSAPMSESGIKRPWEEVRKAANIPWFRQYDCRHTAITRLAEAGVPIDVIMAYAGHTTEKSRRHYTHITQAAQRRGLEQALHHQKMSSQPAYSWATVQRRAQGEGGP